MENLSDPQYTGFSFSQSQAKHTQLIFLVLRMQRVLTSTFCYLLQNWSKASSQKFTRSRFHSYSQRWPQLIFENCDVIKQHLFYSYSQRLTKVDFFKLWCHQTTSWGSEKFDKMVKLYRFIATHRRNLFVMLWIGHWYFYLVRDMAARVNEVNKCDVNLAPAPQGRSPARSAISGFLFPPNRSPLRRIKFQFCSLG